MHAAENGSPTRIALAGEPNKLKLLLGDHSPARKHLDKRTFGLNVAFRPVRLVHYRANHFAINREDACGHVQEPLG